MNLTDIISRTEWSRLEKNINDRFGLNTCIFDTDGFRLTEHQQWPNRLCPEIKANPKGQSFICATAHMNLALQARESRETVVEECDAGMLKLVVPIFVRNEFIGAVSGCGLLLEEGEVDSYLVNMITGIDEEHVNDWASDLAVISRDQAGELAGFIQQQVEEIVAAHQAQDRQPTD